MKSVFKTFLVVVICLVSLSNSVQAQTAFEVPVGGIAITGYDFDNTKFAFVCLTEIPAGTIILFTDNGWFSYTEKFRTGEGVNYWNTPDGCYLGQVVLVGYSELPTYGTNSDMDLSSSGDQIFVYQEKSDGTPHFIFGLNSDGNDWLPYGQSPTANSSNLPDLLAGDPHSAIAIPEKDRGYYNGTRSFNTTTEALAAIVDPSNWTTSDSTLQIPEGDFSFETTAVRLSEFDAKTGGITPPLWVISGLVIVPIAILFFKRPKRDCCS